MERKEVKSSNIKSIGYDEENKNLEIEFHLGAVYSYTGVPKEAYDALMAAESKGSAFARLIKGVFNYHKVKQ